LKVTLAGEPDMDIWQNFSSKSTENGLQPIFILDNEKEEAFDWNVDDHFNTMRDAYRAAEASAPQPPTPPYVNSLAGLAGFADMAAAIDATAVTKAVDALTHPDHPLAGAMKNISQNYGIDIKQAANLLNTEGLKGVIQTHFQTLADMAGGFPAAMQNVQAMQKLEFEPLRLAVAEKDSPEVEDFITAAKEMDLEAWLKARNTPAPPIGETPKDKYPAEPRLSNILLLVPVAHAWQIPAVVHIGGVDENPWAHVHAAIWRRWQEKWGCLPISIGQDIAYLHLSKPVSGEDTLSAAREMAAYSPYSLRADTGNGTISGVAANLAGAQYWECFWG
jgi:hypothetical protein